MSDQTISDYAKGRGFHARTLERLSNWQPEDCAALAELVIKLKMGENHVRDMMDWLEEIALRDSVPIREVLKAKSISASATNPRLSRGDKLKRLKEEMRRMRFPRLAQTEDAVRERVRALKLPADIIVSAPPGLEGGRLLVEFHAASPAELKQAGEKLAAAAETEAAEQIFALLAGKDAGSV